MGDPKFIRKKFEGPSHPWQMKRIEEDKELQREYCLKNKSEIWKMRTKAKNFADQAKNLTAMRGSEQAKKETKQMLDRLFRLKIIRMGATLDDVLSLGVRDMLERRFQTVIFKKGLARTSGQARQLITHRHMMVGGRIVTSPSYLVPASDEDSISFAGKSPFSDEGHPERAVKNAEPKPHKEKKHFRDEHFKRGKPGFHKSDSRRPHQSHQPNHEAHKPHHEAKAGEHKPKPEAKAEEHKPHHEAKPEHHKPKQEGKAE